MSPSWRVVIALVLLSASSLRGEPDRLQTQVVHPVQSQVHEVTPTAGPYGSVIKDGSTYPIANSVIHLPTKVPVTFSAGSPRHGLGKERRSRRGILRRIALPLLILLGLKAGLAIPIIFGGVALAAFKGLWTGTSALMMTSAMGLKNIIPPPKIIIPNGAGAHVQDYIATDYRRADPYFRDDYSRYGGYGYK